MKKIVRAWLLSIVTLAFFACQPTTQPTFIPKLCYQSKSLTISQITPNTFVHTSFLQTESFGNVPCNGLIVKNKDEAIVFDTTTDSTSSNELIHWVERALHCQIKAVVPTHFHEDNLGGLAAFKQCHITAYANRKTIELATKNNTSDSPMQAFNDSLILHIGEQIAIVKYFGEGHTPDNVVAYFPSEHVLFGGCLIKELEADKGYLGDANVANWPQTVAKIKDKYKEANIVVPGHGKYGDTKLLDYTIRLFKPSTPQKP